MINGSVTVEDIYIFENNDLFNENNKNIKKFEDLSIYINYYMKNKLDIFKYEEKDFINKNDYNISKDSEFEIFDIKGRTQFISFLENNMEKEYFFTGPDSIGKTFTLLLFNNHNTKNKRKVYFNIEALKRNYNYFEIIAYETRHLFDSKEIWKNTFIYLQEKEIKDPFDIINYLIELLSQKKNISDTKYFFILDQIQFIEVNEYNTEYKWIKKIIQNIKQTGNCFLIGCCSINYKGVKDLLFNNWFPNEYNTNNIKLNYISSFGNKTANEKEKNYDDNKYLEILGNLPRYKNIKNLLNKKIINILTKKIKEKIEKFYNKNKLSLSDLEKLEIEINKPFKERKAFKLFLDKNPFKYFIINNNNNSIDYAYPLVKKAIKELIESNEIKNFEEKEKKKKNWNFIRKVIDKIKTSHVFGKYYIDNYFEIPILYKGYKIKDEFFSNKENNLFYMAYMNRRRFNFAIYLYDIKALILIKICIKTNKKELINYSKENINKNLNEIQKFLEINELEVNEYYMYFILDEDNFIIKENYELIESFYFQYCLFNYNKNIFTTNVGYFNTINYLGNEKIDINNNDDIKIYGFGIKDDSFIYDNNIKAFKFYAEKGMTLKDFLEQIFDDDKCDKFHQKFKYDEDKYYLIKIGNLIGKELWVVKNEILNGNKILFLNLFAGVLYIGIGDIKEGEIKFSFRTLENEFFCEEIHKFSFMTGFIFKTNEVKSLENI